MTKEKENRSSKDTPTLTTPGKAKEPESSRWSRFPEYKARNAELNGLLEDFVEGMDELFPDMWRRFIPRSLFHWIANLEDRWDGLESWECLEPLRRSLMNSFKRDGRKPPVQPEDPEYADWMCENLLRFYDLYLDIMSDPHNQTDDLSVLDAD